MAQDERDSNKHTVSLLNMGCKDMQIQERLVEIKAKKIVTFTWRIETFEGKETLQNDSN